MAETTYKIKQIPEDFFVKEISNLIIKEQGRYLYFILRKKNRNTMDVVTEMVKILQIRDKDIGFAGSKDKNALTEQICSISGIPKEKLLNLKVKGAELEFVGYADSPISLGDLEGNYFEITIRNIDTFQTEEMKFIENYFDEQRFGSHNAKIGKCLIHKQFSEAVKLIDNHLMNSYLQQKPQDMIGALKKIPLRMLRMYVNAYQSYLWNETLKEYLLKKGKVKKESSYSLGTFLFVQDPSACKDVDIPIIGFSYLEIAANSEVKQILDSIMQRENLEASDFIIKQIPELTLEGEMRKAVVPVKGFVVKRIENDELNSNKKKIVISFTLGKGSYATIVIRSIFG